MLFNTTSSSFEEIISVDKKYIVPKFQRDYAWTEIEWEELLTDIENLDSEESHYMGYLVFQVNTGNEYTVIDGQQRLTTLSLLILAIMHNLNEAVKNGSEVEDNQMRIDALRNKFIGTKNIVSLTVESKLFLNRNNNEHYKRLCTLESPPKRKIKLSEKRMTDSLEYFKAKLKQKFSSGTQLAEYAQNISRKLFFTTIEVDNESNAYKVFETLNARGVKLSVPDLLKNYLFSLIDNDHNCSDSTLKDLDDQWAFITEQLGKQDFDKFIRTDWNTKNPIVTKNNLFKKIKSKVNSAEQAFAYIRELAESSQIYAALQESKDEFWGTPEFTEAIRSLVTLNIFNIIQPQTVLIAAYLKLGKKDFISILKYIEALSIRYNIICQKSPPEQESFYNKIARGIISGNLKSIHEVKSELLKLYPDDKEFMNAFLIRRFKTGKTDKRVRHILTLIERKLSPDNTLADAALTLEHILPQNPAEGWDEFSDENIELYSSYLGNMTLVNDKVNNKLGNKPFLAKKEQYRLSTLGITKKITEYDAWNYESVEDRQRWLANIAVTLWNIN